MEWLAILLPPFIDLLKSLSAGDTAGERQAMIDMELRIAEKKAADKFGPRP